MKKGISIILVILMFCGVTFSFSSCKKSNAKAEYEYWCKSSSEKILQNIMYDDNVKKSKEINVKMAAGEKESTQVIITAKTDVKAYNFVITDLKTASGDIISKDNIDVFNQKYIQVDNNSKFSQVTQLGFYPDAILPFATAKEYNENVVKSGNNQGIFITIKTVDNQKAGIYKGMATLEIDSVKNEIPITVEVWDFSLTQRSFQTSFDLRLEELTSYTLDTSWEKYAEYYEGMLEYDSCALYLPTYTTMDKDKYLAQIKKYWNNKHFTSYGIPTRTIGGADIDVGKLAEYFEIIAKAGITDNKDYLSKAYLYITIIDEPESRGQLELAKYVGGRVKEAKVKACELLANGLSGDKLALAQANVNNVPHIITERYIDELKDTVDIFCPLWERFDAAYEREVYDNMAKEGKKMWWYGCVNPGNPYPSYHTDDNILSARVENWMAIQAGVSGNLYWDMTFPVDITVNRDVLGRSDFYNGAANRYFNANGDGYLCYPGLPYGISGMVASIRLDAARDGVEDYEMLKLLQKLYADNGYDSKYILEPIFETLFSNTRTFAEEATFNDARNNTAKLIQLAKNKVFINDAMLDADVMKLTVTAPRAIQIKLEGDVTDSADANNKTYVNKIKLMADKNNFALTAGDVSLKLPLYGKVAIQKFDTAEKVKAISVKSGGTVTVSDNTNPMGESGAKIKINKAPDSKEQEVVLDCAKLPAINKESIVVFQIFVGDEFTADADLKLKIMIEGDAPIYSTLQTIILKQGINLITVDTFKFVDWNKTGKTKALHFMLGNAGNNERTLIMSDLSIIAR